MSNPIMFSAYKYSGYSSADSYNRYFGSYQTLLTGSSDFFDLSSGTFTAPKSGVYSFSAVAFHKYPSMMTVVEFQSVADEIQ